MMILCHQRPSWKVKVVKALTRELCRLAKFEIDAASMLSLRLATWFGYSFARIGFHQESLESSRQG